MRITFFKYKDGKEKKVIVLSSNKNTIFGIDLSTFNEVKYASIIKKHLSFISKYKDDLNDAGDELNYVLEGLGMWKAYKQHIGLDDKYYQEFDRKNITYHRN